MRAGMIQGFDVVARHASKSRMRSRVVMIIFSIPYIYVYRVYVHAYVSQASARRCKYTTRVNRKYFLYRDYYGRLVLNIIILIDIYIIIHSFEVSKSGS